jgi:predicted dehydrogenase
MPVLRKNGFDFMRGLIVGFGCIGKRHLRNLRRLLPAAELTVVRHQENATSEPDLELADRVVYRLEDALQPLPDFAVICSPAPFHIATAREVASLGVHLLIEKPISDRLDGVDDLIATCQQKRLTLLIGYILRFCPPLEAVRRGIEQKKIGRILGLDAAVGQYLPEWRNNVAYQNSVSARRELGGGALLELSHEIDCARWLGGEIKTLSAFSASVGDLDIDVEDWADLVVEFQSGALGHIHLDMVQRTPSRSGRVMGTEGTITWDVMTNQVQWFSSESRSWEDLHPAITLDRNEMYVREVQHFFDCIRGEASPAVTGQDGKRALEIVLAARESSESRKAVLV